MITAVVAVAAVAAVAAAAVVVAAAAAVAAAAVVTMMMMTTTTMRVFQKQQENGKKQLMPNGKPVGQETRIQELLLLLNYWPLAGRFIHGLKLPTRILHIYQRQNA